MPLTKTQEFDLLKSLIANLPQDSYLHSIMVQAKPHIENAIACDLGFIDQRCVMLRELEEYETKLEELKQRQRDNVSETRDLLRRWER